MERLQDAKYNFVVKHLSFYGNHNTMLCNFMSLPSLVGGQNKATNQDNEEAADPRNCKTGHPSNALPNTVEWLIP